MNFLAHFHLSGNSKDLVVGNFLGDMVRKAEWNNYPEEIVKGIKMHQAIDHFTDNHPIVKEHKKLLHENHGHFAGVILDIFYDYFLAKFWNDYHNDSLHSFAQWVYTSIDGHQNILNEKATMAFSHMKKHNWLEAYASFEGIDQVLNGMSRRTKYDSNMGQAIHDLQKHYFTFHDGFLTFYKELEQFISEWHD